MTHFEEPVDTEGYIDYYAALNIASGQSSTLPQDNAALALFELIDFKGWERNHVEKLYSAWGVAIPQAENPVPWDYQAYLQTNYSDKFSANSVVNETDITWVSDQIMSHPWSDEEFVEIAEWLDVIEPELQLVGRATSGQGYYVPLFRYDENGLLLGHLLPHLSTYQQMAKALRIRVNQYLGDDDVDGAIRDALTVISLARLISFEPSTISKLVANRIEAQGYQTLISIGQLHALTARQIETVSSKIASMPSRRPLKESLCIYERVTVLDLFQQMRRGDAGDDREKKTVPFRLLLHAAVDIDRIMKRVNAVYDRYEDLPNDYHELSELGVIFAADMQSRMHNQSKQFTLQSALLTNMGKDVDAHAVADILADLYIYLLGINAVGAAQTELEYQAFTDLAEVMLALELYQLENKKYPEKLELLVPKYCQQLPVDPFNTGQTFQYSNNTQGYLLHSVKAVPTKHRVLNDTLGQNLLVRISR